MLISYGMGVQLATWHVLEKTPPMYARMYYILGGETVYHQGGISQSLQKGHVYIFPIYTPYEITTNPLAPINCLFLHLDIPNSNLRHLINIALDNDVQMSHLFQAFIDGVTTGSPFRYMEQLTNAFETLCLSRSLFTQLDSRAGSYLNAIREIYRSNTGLEAAAATLGYSTGHFNRCFKEQFGVPPHQYIISLRMSDAIRMLATDVPLDVIGSTIGYADGRSFANAFRSYYGISPSVYRNHYLDRA